MSDAEFVNPLNRPVQEEFNASSAATSQPALADEGLGSLAQSARTSHLRSARTTLFVIGVLTILANLVVVGLATSLVDKQVAEELKGMQLEADQQFDMQVLEQEKQKLVLATQLIAGGFAGIGVVFLILGALIYKFPVPCTVLALVLYIAGQAISGLMDPKMLAQGFVIKIIFIVALVKAVQAALAYRREQLGAAS